MNNNKNGILVVFSGFSGTGKGTVMKKLIEKYPDQYALSISATTRNPRAGEVNGREYFFKSEDQFVEMIHNDQLIEYAKYVDHYYGTPKEYVKEMLLEKDVILEIETVGALKVKEKAPDTLLLFLVPPSLCCLRERLIGRGTEDIDTINHRLQEAFAESARIEKYDFLITNDDLDQCVEQVHQIIQNEHCRTQFNLNLIEQFKMDLSPYSKGE